MARDRLLKNTFVYFLGVMATRLVNFLFLPLYTSKISPEIYGYYDVVYSALSVAIPSLFFMIWEVYLRFFLNGTDEEEKGSVTSTVVISAGVMLVVYLAVFYAVNLFFQIKDAFLISLIGTGWMLASLWQYGMRAYGRNRDYAITGVVATIASAIVNLVMILLLNKQAITLYLAQAASFFTIFAMSEARLKLLSKIRLRLFDWKLLRRMLVYGLPLLVNSVAFWFINYVSRPIINIQIGVEANGYFSAASKFSMIIATVSQIFFFAWQEEAFREANNDKLEGYMSDVMDQYIRLLLGGVCFGLPLLRIVLPFIIVNNSFNYAQAYPIVPVMIMMAVYSALSSFAGTAYSARMKTNIIMYTTIAGGALSFSLAWFGAKPFGLMAVAVASAAGFLLVFLLRVAFSRKIVRLRLNWMMFLGLNLAAAAAIAAFYAESVWVQAAASAAGFGLMLALNRKLLGQALRKAKGMLKPKQS